MLIIERQRSQGVGSAFKSFFPLETPLGPCSREQLSEKAVVSLACGVRGQSSGLPQWRKTDE